MMGDMISTRNARRIRTGINIGRNLAANPNLVPGYMLTLIGASRLEIKATARAGGSRLAETLRPAMERRHRR